MEPKVATRPQTKPVEVPRSQYIPNIRGMKTQQAITPKLRETRGTISSGTFRAMRADTAIIRSPTTLVRTRTLASGISGRRKRRVSAVRDVVVTRTMALIVDMAADIAARRMTASKPGGRSDVATKGMRLSGLAI